MRSTHYTSCLVGDAAENAKAFLHAYMERMPHKTGYRGAHAQQYHLWRTRWMIACLDQLPAWGYKSEPERQARVEVGMDLRRLAACQLLKEHPHVNSVF